MWMTSTKGVGEALSNIVRCCFPAAGSLPRTYMTVFGKTADVLVPTIVRL